MIFIAYNTIPVRPERKSSDLVNESIRFPEVLVIDPNGKQLGVLSRYAALQAAEQFGMDLLCVAPSAKPPVCKILDYGKYRFEMQKKAKEAKKNQHIIDIKEVQITPQIGENDLMVKVKGAIGFFQEGDKVKLVLRFRGRQMTHIELGTETMTRFIQLVSEYAIVEKRPELEGKLMTAILSSTVKK